MILFFGPPGSGKSVQGQLLVERNGWAWLSTGELFRKSTDPEVLARLASGELIDDALTNKVLADALGKIGNVPHIVLDGYPRNTDQAKWLIEHLESQNRRVSAIIVFQVPEEELTKRLAGRGRDEDNLDVIKRRLEIYHEQTRPVLDFFKSENMPLTIIDGVGEVAEIHERIQAAVEQLDLV